MVKGKAGSVAGVAGKDPTLPRVSIVLDGEEYFLCYDFNAIASVEELTGLNMFDSFSAQRMNAGLLRATLYASLLHNHPDLHLEDVGKMIRPERINDIISAITEAWFGSIPDAPKNAESALGQS